MLKGRKNGLRYGMESFQSDVAGRIPRTEENVEKLAIDVESDILVHDSRNVYLHLRPPNGEFDTEIDIFGRGNRKSVDQYTDRFCTDQADSFAIL